MDAFAPRNTTPDRTIPRFHMRAVEMPFKSREAGRPIYEDREFVEIIIPGMPKSTACEPVNDQHIARWPQIYDLFKRGVEAPVTGTPLEEWNVLSAATVQNLKSLALRTVEDVAGASDSVLQNMGQGGFDFRRRAQAYLETAKGSAPTEALMQQNELMRAKIEVLESQVKDLADLVQLYEEADKDQAPKRGRPAKAA
jgi:hypothetical protein